jgi:hypothetical protein
LICVDAPELKQQPWGAIAQLRLRFDYFNNNKRVSYKETFTYKENFD